LKRTIDDFSEIGDSFIKENEWIIYYALSKKPWAFHDLDIMQEARIWLCEAKRRWKPKRSSWKTFASNYIKWKYNNHGRNDRLVMKRSPRLNGYSIVPLDDAEDCQACPDDSSDERITCSSMLDLVVNPRSRRIVLMRLNGWSFTEIGEEYHFTKQTARNIYNREMDRIRSMM
jgi:RNA polymerase sigma factor (sigma-70 family)